MTSKKERLVFTSIMCGIMVFIMSVYNVSLNEGTFSSTVLLHALQGFFPAYAVAFLCDWFIVGKPAKACAFTIVEPDDVLIKKILAISFFMVSGMVLCMSFYGAVLHVGITEDLPRAYVKGIMFNFAAALPVQLLIAGPSTRFIYSKVMPAAA